MIREGSWHIKDYISSKTGSCLDMKILVFLVLHTSIQNVELLICPNNKYYWTNYIFFVFLDPHIPWFQ